MYHDVMIQNQVWVIIPIPQVQEANKSWNTIIII